VSFCVGGLGSIRLTTGDAMDLWVGILDHRFKESASVLLCWRLGLYKPDDGGYYLIFGLGSEITVSMRVPGTFGLESWALEC
jgi:hypothetical protein